MNRKSIGEFIGLILIIGVITGITALYYQNLTRVAPAASRVALLEEEPRPRTLRELLALNQPLSCTYNSGMQSDGSLVTGTVYFAPGQARGDFVSVANGATTTGHSIITADQSYSWLDGAASGFKIALSALKPGEATAAAGVDLSKELKYECTDWTSDSIKFSLPKDVSFTDFSLLVRTGLGANAKVNGGTAQCAVCDIVPAEYGAQCRAHMCQI